ncbi:MAG: hypothetical protein KDA85_08870, partial [Planctomycetaceae bacterium]|nr:hypothetical protein [Planctomycetaceae bacterium]
MTSLVHHFSLRALATIGVVLVLLASGTPVQSQDKGAPPWGEFLKRFNKDPLLKTPYHMEEADAGPKGLAAKIRARELDIPNRKRAIRYLADLNCAQFPEAKQMLLEMLNPEKERWEEVRYEAALGLRDMLARNACGTGQCQNGQCQTGNCQTGNCQSGQCGQCQSGGFGGAWERCCDTAARTVSRSKKSKADEGMCYCTNCCDAETMQTLAKTAYEMKEDGCCYEPSLRVRQMAVEAIRVCGIPCNYAPYYATEEAGPMPTEEVGGQQQQ